MSIKLMAQTMDGCSILNKLLRRVQLCQENDGNATNCQNVSIFTIKKSPKATQSFYSLMSKSNGQQSKLRSGALAGGSTVSGAKELFLESQPCSHTNSLGVWPQGCYTIPLYLYTMPGLTRPLHNAWLDRHLHNAWLDRPLHNAWIDRPLHNAWFDRPLHNAWIDRPLYNAWFDRPLHNAWTDRPLHNAWTDRLLYNALLDRPLHNAWTDRPLHNACLDRPLQNAWINRHLHNAFTQCLNWQTFTQCSHWLTFTHCVSFLHPQPPTLACCWHNHGNCSLYKAICIISSWRHFKKEKDLGGYHANCSQRMHRIMWGWLYTPLSQAHEYVLHHTPALTD